jgi:hypothetical protein
MRQGKPSPTGYKKTTNISLLIGGRRRKTRTSHRPSNYRRVVVAKVRERLAVNNKQSIEFSVERFNLKKINEVEGKEQYHVEISNRFAALENLGTEECLENY